MMSDSTMSLGDLAPRACEFCPLQAVSKFPYRYLNKYDMELVSSAFFASGRFRARGWSVYYVHTYLPSTKPLLLVPIREFQALLKDINKELEIQIRIPRVAGFRICFSDEGSPRARYLGQLTSDTEVASLERMVPGPNFKGDGGNEVLDDRSFAAFKKKIEASIEAGKNKSKAQRERKKNERIVLKKGWFAEMKRVQCYLGARPCRTATETDDPIRNSELAWDDLQKACEVHQFASGTNLPKLDTTKPVPYPFDMDVVFVCVDVESYERQHKAITEVGISSLDTKDLIGIPPGQDGKSWIDKIHSRHFRIRETSHLQNTEFVVGCPDRFEKAFGISEWISKEEAPKVVAACFRPPFATRPLNASTTRYPSIQQTKNGLSNTKSSAHSSDLQYEVDTQPKRNLVLVGHNTESDIEYLRDLGYDVRNPSNLVEAVDTVNLYRAWKQDQTPRNLGQVLLDLDLTGWNLHNAGNDAAYTLQSMIGIAFSSLSKNQTHQSRLEALTQDAEERAKQEKEEWELAVGEDGDGGSAVRLHSQDADWTASRPIPAKSRKVLAQKKAMREEKPTEKQTRGGAPVNKKPSGNKHVEGWASWADGKQDKDNYDTKVDSTTLKATNGKPETKPNHIPNAASFGDPIVESRQPPKPSENTTLPSQFTERMAYLDIDDDEDGGGVTIVYR